MEWPRLWIPAQLRLQDVKLVMQSNSTEAGSNYHDPVSREGPRRAGGGYCGILGSAASDFSTMYRTPNKPETCVRIYFLWTRCQQQREPSRPLALWIIILDYWELANHYLFIYLFIAHIKHIHYKSGYYMFSSVQIEDIKRLDWR